MNYTIRIPSDEGIEAIKLVAVAGALTTANSRVSVNDEFIATCTAGDSVVVFEAGVGSIPSEGLPSGNYTLYTATNSTTPIWSENTEIGTVSIVNNDTGEVLEEKVEQATYDSDKTALDASIADHETRITTVEALYTTLDGRVTNIEDIEDSLATLIADISAVVLSTGSYDGNHKVRATAERPLITVGGVDVPAMGIFNFEWHFSNSATAPTWSGLTIGKYSGNQTGYDNTIFIDKPEAGDSLYNNTAYLHFRVKLSNAVTQTAWKEDSADEIDEPSDVSVTAIVTELIEQMGTTTPGQELKEDIARLSKQYDQ